MQALPGDSQKHAENYQLPDIGRLKKELPRQRLLYQEGSLEQMKEAFDAAGFNIPYPQMDIHMR